jgi:hypothetical protein
MAIDIKTCAGLIYNEFIVGNKTGKGVLYKWFVYEISGFKYPITGSSLFG